MLRRKSVYQGLKVVDGNKIRKPKNVSSIARRAARRAMHRKQLLGGKLFPLDFGCSDNCGPVIRRDTRTLLPLLDTPMGLTDGFSHLSEGIPQLEEIIKCGHAADCAGDYLSRQPGAINPVTIQALIGTMCPHMGRGTTPSSVKKAIAQRLRAARIAHGAYPTQAPFAKALNIEVERYKKWESGRTPIPPEFIWPICELLGQDANYLFDVRAKELRKTG